MRLLKLKSHDWFIVVIASILGFFSFVGEHDAVASAFLAMGLGATCMLQLTKSRNSN